MNYNTQNTKIASITEKTLIVGIDVGSETHYARAFDWRNYEYSKKPFAFNNDEVGFAAFKTWMEDIADKHDKEAVIPGMEPTGHYWLNLGAYPQLMWADDPGRHGRFAAVDGWVYTRPCRTKRKTFYFVYPKSTIFVPDTEKCPFL